MQPIPQDPPANGTDGVTPDPAQQDRSGHFGGQMGGPMGQMPGQMPMTSQPGMNPMGNQPGQQNMLSMGQECFSHFNLIS